MRWRKKTRFKNPEDWVFASPFKAGRLPGYPWGVERRHLIPAGIRLRDRTRRLAHVQAHVPDALG